MNASQLKLAHKSSDDTDSNGQSEDQGMSVLSENNNTESDIETEGPQAEVLKPDLKKRSTAFKILLLVGGVFMLLVLILGIAFAFLGMGSDEKILKSKITPKEESVFPDEAVGAAPAVTTEKITSDPVAFGQPEQDVMTGDDIKLTMEPAAVELSEGMRNALYSSDETSVNLDQQVEQNNASPDVITGPDIQGAVANNQKNIELLTEQYSALKKVVETNGEQLKANQTAIIQTANLIVSVKKSIQQTKNDVVQLRSVAFDNQDRIKALEERLKGFSVSSLGANRSEYQVRNEASKSESIVDPFDRDPSQPIKKHVPVYPNSDKPKSLFPDNPAPMENKAANPVSNNATVITQLKVMAIHNDKAVVYDDKNKQYLLKRGLSYKNLGLVIDVNSASGTVSGKFDNGTEWIILQR